jgi:DNA-binding NarL/FixJ family response regulator
LSRVGKGFLMSNRVKIFIVEYDCVSLITLMLWLDQFPDFEVLGTTVDTGRLAEQISELQPDVVLLDIATPGPEDIAPLLQIKSVEPDPAVLLLYHGDPKGLRGILEDESEGQLGPDRTLGDLHGAILKAYNRRRASDNRLVALAG